MEPSVQPQRTEAAAGRAADTRTVCVAGATGFIGRQSIRALLDHGHLVRALVRDPDKAAAVLPRDERLSLYVGDPAEGRGLEAWADGADGAVNTIGIIREAPGGQTFARIHAGVARCLTEAARRGGIEHFVQVSALGVTDEADTAYARTKFEAEMIVRASGLHWTILRPSMVHGPEGEFMRLARGWATGRAAPFVFLPYFTRPVMAAGRLLPKFEPALVAPISVVDVAEAIARSIERPGCRGEIIHLCGRERLSWPALLEFVRDRVVNGKRELRTVGLPAPVAALKARAARLVGLRDALPFDEGMAIMAARDSVCDMEKASEHLDLSPAGFRESAGAYLPGM